MLFLASLLFVAETDPYMVFKFLIFNHSINIKDALNIIWYTPFINVR